MAQPAVRPDIDEGRSTSVFTEHTRYSSGICRTGKITAPLGWRGYVASEVAATDYLFQTRGAKGSGWPARGGVKPWPGGSVCPVGCLRVWPGELLCGGQRSDYGGVNVGALAVGPRMWMSRCCSSVSTSVAGRQAPGAGGRRALCCGDRGRACQRHQVSRRHCGA